MEMPSATPILDLNSWKCWRESDFVRRSMSWSMVWMCWTRIVPFLTRSRTKRRSISMCFIHVCWTGFKLKWLAPILSQNIWGASLRVRPSSLIREWSQTVSDVAIASARNSASVDDLETALCLRADHEIGLRPMNVMKAVVETRVSVFDAQSASL